MAFSSQMTQSVKRSGFPAVFLDPSRPTRDDAREHFTYSPDLRVWGIPGLIGLALLLVSAVGWALDPQQFYFSYLVGWFFCLTISLGSLFFVLAHHLSRAHWGISVRRIAEALAYSFPLLAVLSIPIWIGMGDLYHWMHHDVYVEGSEEYDPILAGKQGYLNLPFFVARAVLYFALWTVISWKLYRLSVEQDVHSDPSIPVRQRKVSAWGVVAFALTIAFASYDFVMSLDPHWFSTIFGVYAFAGAFWVANAMIVILARVIQRGGAARRVITIEHYHDLGKWMFAFTVFWAYIAFSQYMLYWYGNIPEETIWFRHRLEHGWENHSMILLVGHFILPFLILLPRATKRTLPLLTFMAAYVLAFHWFDLHWLSMPALHEHATIHWLDITAWLGLFGIYLSATIYRLSRHSVVPQHDPRLARSIAFENV